MPREARIDIEGYLYHVIARGIERRNIFPGKEDYEDFTSRLEESIAETKNKCLAWCLMPNHFHLLILRGRKPLSDLMRRLMTGYAVKFNIRHKRAGHLFQNRYKSIICDEDAYLLELTAYIHLNPLRSRIVRNMGELERYEWCGHGEYVGRQKVRFMDRDYVLSQFSSNRRDAVKKYNEFIEERITRYKGGEYSGGGLIKSMGGLGNILALRSDGVKEMYDYRMLGDGEFVEKVLDKIEIEIEEKIPSEEVLNEAIKITGISKEDILHPSRNRRASVGRAIYCYLAREKSGLRVTDLEKQLKATSSGISRMVEKGRKIMFSKTS